MVDGERLFLEKIVQPDLTGTVGCGWILVLARECPDSDHGLRWRRRTRQSLIDSTGPGGWVTMSNNDIGTAN